MSEETITLVHEDYIDEKSIDESKLPGDIQGKITALDAKIDAYNELPDDAENANAMESEIESESKSIKALIIGWEKLPPVVEAPKVPAATPPVDVPPVVSNTPPVDTPPAPPTPPVDTPPVDTPPVVKTEEEKAAEAAKKKKEEDDDYSAFSWMQ